MANETIIPESMLPELRRKVMETGISIVIKKVGETYSICSAGSESLHNINTPCQSCARGVNDCIKYGAPFPRKSEDYDFCLIGYELVDPTERKCNVIIAECENYIPSKPAKKITPLDKRALRETIACLYYDAPDMEEVQSIRHRIELERRKTIQQKNNKK